MSGFQVLTLVATLLGITATALNLVAFVREKDRSHTRAGILFLLLLVSVLGVAFLPRYAPNVARRIVAGMPATVARTVTPWLNDDAQSVALVSSDRTPADPALLGSFTIEIQRNLLGGIGALVSNFQFSNPANQGVQVTAYHMRLTPKLGEAPRNYDRVLAEPLLVGPKGTAKTQVELDAEIRDQWVGRERLEASERGPIELLWDCQDADGRSFQVRSVNG